MKRSRYVTGARRPRLVEGHGTMQRLLAGALLVGAGLLASVTAGSASTAATAQAAPTNTSPPAISGTPQEGKQLSGDKGAWTGSPTAYKYFWMRCNKNGGGCSNINGATGLTYSPGSADVGNTLRFKVKATNAGGDTFASSVPSAVITAATKSPPTNTAQPAISGSAQVGQKLTGDKGTWTGSPSDYNLSWTRCNSGGNACTGIVGAGAATYTVTSVDVGHTLRFKVGAANQDGRTFASSAQTAVVTAAAPPPPPAGSTITVDKVSPPDRLIVDKVSFSPNPTRTRGPIIARFHVSDTQSHPIQGALVYALGLPYGWVRHAAETPTDASGWATISLQPTAAMPLHRGGALVVFVRARKPGDNLLAGVSTRRLVQEGISR